MNRICPLANCSMAMRVSNHSRLKTVFFWGKCPTRGKKSTWAHECNLKQHTQADLWKLNMGSRKSF